MGNSFEQEMQKASVFSDRNIISPHYLPKELPFREKQISEITRLLATALKGKKPNNLFVYGKVGTGKTATVKHVLQEMKEYAGKNNAKVRTCYLNCRTHNSKYKALMKCCKEFHPKENFLGFSAAFIFEKVLEFAQKNESEVIVVLDEVDKVKDLDELIYSLTRGNDELEKGSLSIIGISNNLMFKERLDARTKSTLCEKEMIFPPYNAVELREILRQRVQEAFRKNSVQESALNLAAAIAAQESGDARTAVLIMLRAGELADELEKNFVTDTEVKKAREKVEAELIFNMISTLPDQEMLVLYTIASLALKQKPLQKLTGAKEKGVLYSGEVFEQYQKVAKKLKETSVTARWFRAYINELEMYGLINTTRSGPGMVGNTRLLKLNCEPLRVKESIEKELGIE